MGYMKNTVKRVLKVLNRANCDCRQMVTKNYFISQVKIDFLLFRGHPHMISDFLGHFLTYLPTYIRLYPILSYLPKI